MQFSPIQPQQLFPQQPQTTPPQTAPRQTNADMSKETPVMRISRDLPLGTPMLWCDGMYCGLGNHTTARHDEAMLLQETHPDSGPSYTTKDGAFNPPSLICNCCGKTGHQFKKCPHADKPNASERIAEGILPGENRKAGTKNNVDAVNSILAAKGVDTHSLSFNKDYGDRGSRNTSPPAPRPVVHAPPAQAPAPIAPSATPDMVTCMLQALQLFSQSQGGTASPAAGQSHPPSAAPSVNPYSSVGPSTVPSPVLEPTIDSVSTVSGPQSLASAPSTGSCSGWHYGFPGQSQTHPGTTSVRGCRRNA